MTPWTAALQGPLSSTVSQSLLKLKSIESVMLSTISFSAALFFCLQSFPASRSFLSQLFTSGGQSFSFSISPYNEYSKFFPLGLTGLRKVPLLYPFNRRGSDAQRVWIIAQVHRLGKWLSKNCNLQKGNASLLTIPQMLRTQLGIDSIKIYAK